MKTKARVMLQTATLATLVSIICSCSLPLTPGMVLQVKDSSAPAITVISPAENSFYSSVVVVEGVVTDDSQSTSDGKGHVRAFRFRVLDSAIAADVHLEEDGSFAFSFSTRGLTGDLSVELIAEDWNANETRKTLSLLSDGNGPYLAIDTPSEGAAYASTVVVEGRVGNSASETDSVSEVKLLEYEVLTSTIQGTPGYSADGFMFQFSAAGWSGPMVLVVRAHDWNGNVTEVRRTLTNAGNQIPSFTATPGNHRVTLEWDPVPLADRYTIHYTGNGSLPSQDYGTSVDGVTAPWVMEDLPNGHMHVFLLQAHSSAGPDNWSAYQHAIPLSSLTLAPHLEPDNDSIRVQWFPIPGTDEFEVWRSTVDSPEPVNISGSVRGFEYRDSLANAGVDNFYHVRPALAGSVMSGSRSARLNELPTEWTRVAGTVPAVWAWHHTVDGNYLYTSDLHAKTVVIYDVSSPESPVAVAEYASQTYANDIAVYGDHMYLALGAAGLEIVSIADKAAPQFVATYGDSVAANYLALAGDRLFVSRGEDGLVLLSLTDPAAPTELGSIGVASYSSGAVVAHGSYAYVAEGHVYVLDATDPSNLSWVGAMPDPGHGYPQGLAVEGSVLYATFRRQVGGSTVGPGGLYAFDLTIPSAPTLLGQYEPLEHGRDVAVIGDQVFVTDRWDGLRRFDVSDPANIRQIDVLSVSDAGRISAYIDHLFVRDVAGALRIVDTRLPVTPVLTYEIAVPTGAATDMEIHGRHAFVATFDAGLLIYDVLRSPPVLVGSHGTGSMNGVTVVGNLAYVTTDYGVQVVDISAPATPSVVGSYETTLHTRDLLVYGDYGYLNAGAMIQVLDLWDPTDIREAGVYTEHIEALYGKTRFRDGMLFVPNSNNGYLVLALDEPTRPRLAAAHGSTYGFVMNLAVGGDSLIAHNFEYGLVSDDISDPSNPVRVDTYMESVARANTGQVALAGSYIVSSLYSSMDPQWVRTDLVYLQPSGVFSHALTLSSEVWGSPVISGARLFLMEWGSPDSPIRMYDLVP